MSSNTFLFNAQVRHQIFLQRFAGGEAKGLLGAVDLSRKEINNLLRGKEVAKMTAAQKSKLFTSVTSILKRTYGEQNKKTFKNMKEFSRYEGEFGTNMLKKGTDVGIKTPTARQLDNTIFRSKIDFGPAGALTIGSALGQFSRRKQKQAVQVIRDGIVEGLTNQQIRSRMNKAVSAVNQNHAKTLIRTITNHVATGSRQALFKQNKDIIKEVRWVSVLDDHTSDICQGLDGKIFPKESGPRPPIHWSCRSTIAPIIKKQFDAVPGVKTSRFARGAEGKESVSGKTTYNSWLKTQPGSFQDEVLGKTRGKLFREGGLAVDKFTDNNFKGLSLKELKQTEPLAFTKAGLD